MNTKSLMNSKTHQVLIIVYALVVSLFPCRADALLNTVTRQVISDSEEPIARRIYSYDIGIDSNNDVHIVYSKPSGEETSNIYYKRRVSGTWQEKQLVTANGYRPSVSTWLVVGSDNRVHICYIKNEGNGGNLYYKVYKNGVVETPETYVDSGGWHTRMQVNEDGNPIFIRDNKTWPDLVSKLLMVTTKDGGSTWEEPSYLNLPQVSTFRIANFVYDVNNRVYHITYGDSAYTRNVYQFHFTSAKINRTFHNLHYASSSDGINWNHEKIYSAGWLHDLEFWTTMVLDDGNPLVGMFEYHEDGGEYATGTKALLIAYKNGSWTQSTISDRSYKPNYTREGMGIGLAVNGSGDYFGVWNYSPPYVIQDEEFSDSYGNIAMARNGVRNDWTAKGRVDAYSLEGNARVQIKGGKLYVLGLMDYGDVKLYFREYNIPYLTGALPYYGNDNGSGGRLLPGVNLLLMKGNNM